MYYGIKGSIPDFKPYLTWLVKIKMFKFHLTNSSEWLI